MLLIIEMGTTKNIGFKDDIKNLAEVFKALGHPARIQIMNILLSKKSCSCGNIVEVLPLAQSTVSKHLLELKKANLINITFSGKSSIYSVEKSKLNILNQFIDNYMNSLEQEKIEILPKLASNSKLTKTSTKSLTPKKHLKQFNYQFKKK